MARAATSRRRNFAGFGWLSKKKLTHSSSASTKAYKAGQKSGDTGAFDSWLKGQRLGDISGGMRKTLEERYRAGVEKGEDRAQKVTEQKDERERSRELLAELKDDAYGAGRNDKQSGKKPSPYRISLLTSPRWEEAFGKRKARELVQSAYKAGYQNPQCARTVKAAVSDRAKRYRANQPGCRPSGSKKCKLCGAKRFLTVDHIDGVESNGKKSNLRWLCKSCNTRLGVAFAKEGIGQRTAQYNPKGAYNFAEWSEAVATLRGEGSGTMTREQAGLIVHETSKRRRAEFQDDVWRIRKERYGPSGRKDGGAGGAHSDDAPDWVTNPGSKYKAYSSALLREMLSNVYPQQIGASDKRAIKKELDNRAKSNPAASAAQYRLAQAVLSGTARTPTRMTRTVAQEIVELTPAHLRSEYSRSNPNPPESTTEYRLGYSLGQMDRQNAALRRTDDELTATFKSEFFPDEWWKRCPIFISGYDDGFGFNGLAGGPTARNGGRQVNGGLPKRNPATASEDDGSEDYKNAKRIAELFHGRPVKEHLTVTETIRSHDWYAALGPLVELRIKAFKGAPFRTAKFKFPVKGDLTIQFFTSPDGKQFYLRGGDQEINLESLDMGPDSEWFRDSMLIGDVTYFVYRDGKKFHRFKITDYSHKVGSGLDSSGARHVQKTTIKPVMIYDSLSKKISFAGGLGKVETEDLVDGMSPGIVN